MQNVIPPAITGPAAIPLKKTIPIIVPSTRATVISGCPSRSPTPLEDKIETEIPLIIATQPIGVLKALNKCENPISPVAIGINMAIVIIKTPQFIPSYVNCVIIFPTLIPLIL